MPTSKNLSHPNARVLLPIGDSVQPFHYFLNGMACPGRLARGGQRLVTRQNILKSGARAGNPAFDRTNGNTLNIGRILLGKTAGPDQDQRLTLS